MSTANLDLELPVSGRSILDFYDEASRAPLAAGKIRILSLPVECPDPGRLLSLDLAEDGFLWRAPQGLWAAALGVAEVVSVSGEDRFSRLRERSSELLQRVETESFEGDSAGVPIALYGGAAFHPGAAENGAWRGFGDCRFVLPRYAVTRGAAAEGAQALARLLVAVDQATQGSVAARRSLTEVVCHLTTAPPARSWRRSAARDEPFRVNEPPSSWIRQVEEIRKAIADGRLAKVVAARRIEVELGREIDPLALVDLLEGRRSGCTRFAVRRLGRAFVGATPERLIRRQGRRVTTHALAGSIDRSGGDVRLSAERLLESAKDGLEHRLVVDHLVERLRPLCSSFSWNPTPTVRELRSVLHLETEMEGVLDSARHILDLVDLLHPTPAVGGVPVADAVRWTVANEEHPRGWYAGPVGWFDGSGDGDFAVALRSVLLDGRRAVAHAGAGILAESSPVAEFHETEIKLRSLRAALDRVLAGDLEAAVPAAGAASALSLRR